MVYLYVVGIAISSLSALFIYLFKRPLKIEDKLLIIWILMMSGKFLLDLIDQGGRAYLTEIRMTIGVSYYIFIFLHLKYLTRESNLFRLADLLYFIHVPILFAYMVYTKYADFGNSIVEFPNARRVVHYSYAISSLIFSTLAAIILWKHNKYLKQFYSYTSLKLDLLWVGGLLFYNIAAVVIIWILLLDEETVVNVPAYFNVNYIILIFCLTVLRIWQVNITPTLEVDVRYHRSSLNPDKVEGYVKKLKDHMMENKPYIINDFTLQHLADQIDIPKHHLSEILNKHMNVSFYNYIREYRIQHVIDLLGQKEYRHIKLMSIGFDSGFSSKSNFNKAFKDVTGKTPSEYQATLL